MKFLLERPVKQPVLDSLFNYLTKRVLMGVPSSQLTTNFSAKNHLTTIFLANSQLTTNSSYLSTFTFLQRILFRIFFTSVRQSILGVGPTKFRFKLT